MLWNCIPSIPQMVGEQQLQSVASVFTCTPVISEDMCMCVLNRKRGFRSSWIFLFSKVFTFLSLELLCQYSLQERHQHMVQQGDSGELKIRISRQHLLFCQGFLGSLRYSIPLGFYDSIVLFWKWLTILQMLKWSQKEITCVPEAMEPVNGKTQSQSPSCFCFLFIQVLFLPLLLLGVHQASSSQT